MALETPSRPPPPFMANAILNFHFDFLKPSLIKNINILNIIYPDQVGCMDRGMQAVPVLVEGGSQTQLTHPKNVYIQYESR